MPHCCEAVRVRELRLYLSIRPFGSLLLGQVQHECHALVRLSIELRCATQYRHTATVLSNVFFLVGLRCSGCSHLKYSLLSNGMPFRRRQLPPVQTRFDSFSSISNDTEKGIVCIDAFAIITTPHDKAYDVRFEQAPYLAFSVLQLFVEPYFLQLYLRLSRQ